jgi:arylsulfatase A-like enzyme
VTDAFGDEATKFVADHANQADPFFLYVSFTGPHSPYPQAKEQDLAEFDSTSLSGFRKNAAALTYAVDRNVGHILDRVSDPDGNGDTSDSIADNTIILFLNDNGAPSPIDPQAGGQVVHDNSPLRGFKNNGWEGAVRVPMMIRAPGVDPGVYDEMVSALDFLPTFVQAAGGTPDANLDGVDLMPYLEGTQTGPVHDKARLAHGRE